MATILLIDDSEDIRETVADILRYEGYTVRAEPHGRAGLEALAALETLPNAIILDLRMPVMGGVEFLQYLRERPDWAAIPVIVTSGTVEHARIAALAPLAGALRKPVDIPTLLTLLLRLCGETATSAMHVEASQPAPLPLAASE